MHECVSQAGDRRVAMCMQTEELCNSCTLSLSQSSATQLDNKFKHHATAFCLCMVNGDIRLISTWQKGAFSSAAPMLKERYAEPN